MEKIALLKERWLKKEIANLKENGISKSDIADRLDIKPQYLNNILNGGRGITDAFLDKFIEAFEINQFDLLLTQASTTTVDKEVVYMSDPRDAEIISSKNEMIETQKDLILSLKQRIKDLERGSSFSHASGFTSVHPVDTTSPKRSGQKAKQPNK